ncbi:MAG TPA: tetratricopeptide repeat protein [Chthoniobacterales bacterium]|nr:tetratricopeptide repeat protein [Chthoniobacterales bacterium]
MASSKTNRSDADRRQYLANYILTVIVSAAMGAGITWMFTSQRSTPAAHPVLSTPAPVAQSDVAPDVTGMSPSQAALILGNFAYDHQRWSEAIGKYQEAISSGIDNADVHTDLGNAYRFSGQPEEALNQYTIAQKLNPQHENSLFNQISLFSETLNQPGRAIPICEEFIRRFPTSDKIPAVQQQLAKAKGIAP